MAEEVMIQASKWGVAAEAHVETEIKHDYAPPVKVDDSCSEFVELNHEYRDSNDILRCHEGEPCIQMHVAAAYRMETEIKHDNDLTATVDSCTDLQELNQENHDCGQTLRRYGAESCDGSEIDRANCQSGQAENSIVMHSDDFRENAQKCYEAEPCIQMHVAATHRVETEIKHDNTLTAPADDSCIDLPELNQESHDCGKIFSRYEAESCDGSEIDRSDYQSRQVENNILTHSDDFCENAQKSKQLDPEGDSKDGFRKQDLELSSNDQTIEYPEQQDKPMKDPNAMSPNPKERRQWNRNISPTDGWGRSGRKRSRSRSRSFSQDSRSRSPFNASKHRYESWAEKGSTRHAGTACRDFAADRCRHGSECIYLHEGGSRRQIDWHHDSGSTDERESRFERGRHQGYVSREGVPDSRQKMNYSREKNFRRHEDHFDDKRDNNEKPRGYRSNEMCYDFTRGRCLRGASCRYIHHETPSVGGRNVSDEFSGRVYDRRDGRTSFGRRLEPQRVSSVPCKFFLEGRCRNGENCKFFHQVGPLSNSEDRSRDDSSHQLAGTSDRASANALERLHQVTHFDPTNSQPMGSENASRVGNTHPICDKGFTNKSPCDRHPTLTQGARSEIKPSGKQAALNIRQKFSANVNNEGAREGKDTELTNNILPITNTADQNLQQSGQNQIAFQLMHAQKFASSFPFQQFVPQLPLNEQMQHAMNQSGQNPFTSLHKPSDAHQFIATKQSLSNHHPESNLNLQKLNYGRQVQPGLLVQSHVANQQIHNVSGQTQENLPLPQNGQSQSNFNVSGQIQQMFPSQVVHRQQESIITGDPRHILPQNVQSQQCSVPLLVSNGQIDLVASKPPSNPGNISSDEKGYHLTSENNLDALQQSKQMASGKLLQGADLSEIKTSVFNSDNLNAHKLVTTDQASKITGHSASLAQFFGTAVLNSQSTTGILTPADLKPGSLGRLVTVAAPLLTEVEGSKTHLNHSAPSALTVLVEKPHKQIRTLEQIKDGGDASKFEKLQNNEELPARIQNGDPEVRKDGDVKRSKETKEFRMFKCALVELVKDMLKPTWKEGQLSKESHNTIVKKVVDKVTGSLQSHTAPQTQEKIDLYLSSSKAKLSKLVQAYVEKYVGR